METLKIRKARLNFDREHLKESAYFWNFFWTDETKISMCQNDGKSKEKGTAHVSISH